MSELKYSKTGIPFIHLVDAAGKTYGDFIFSNMTKTETGYKYICFTHRKIDMVATKSGKGKSNFVEVATNDSYVFNMVLKRDEAGKKGVPQGMMPKRLSDWIRAVISEFTIDGIFLFSDIKFLEPIIADLDIDIVLVTESERVREANKKARHQKKLDKIAAVDQEQADEKVMGECIMTGYDKNTIHKKRESQKLSDIF
jgi:hypothetical protein